MTNDNVQKTRWVELKLELEPRLLAKFTTDPLASSEIISRITKRFLDDDRYTVITNDQYVISPHHTITQGDMVSDYITGFGCANYCILWFENPIPNGLGYNVVAIMPDGSWEEFARKTFKLIRRHIPRGYRISAYRLFTFRVDHEFTLAKPTITPDAVALLMAGITWAVGWVLVRKSVGADLNSQFFLSVGASALHGVVLSLLTLLFRRIFRRRVVYVNEP